MEDAVGYPQSKFQVSRRIWSEIGIFLFTQTTDEWNECVLEITDSIMSLNLDVLTDFQLFFIKKIKSAFLRHLKKRDTFFWLSRAVLLPLFVHVILLTRLFLLGFHMPPGLL